MASRIVTRMAVCLFAVWLASCRAANQLAAEGESAVVIIFYDPAVGNKALLKAVRAYGSPIVYQYRQLHGMAVKVPPRKSLQQTLKYYRQVKGVLSASPDEKMRLMDDGRDFK